MTPASVMPMPSVMRMPSVMPMPRSLLILPLLAAMALGLAAPRPAPAADRWAALQGLSRIAVDITFSPQHVDLAAEEVRPRVEEALRRAQPAPALDPASTDRLRLVVSVRSYSSSDLRGYYLPLSQAYGIGPVRLGVERAAAIPGITGLLPVTVWLTERQAKGPWRSSATEILELVDEVVAAFLADYRRAQGQ
jgi:hypothetical protein